MSSRATLPSKRTLARGFTLVECLLVCAVAGVLASLALPAYRGHDLRMARLDGVAALTRLQSEQESFRSTHGLYAGDLAPLRGVAALSAQGRYAVSVASTGPDSFRATASARGAQLEDRDCPVLTLDVSLGFAHAGPSARCWNR